MAMAAEMEGGYFATILAEPGSKCGLSNSRLTRNPKNSRCGASPQPVIKSLEDPLSPDKSGKVVRDVSIERQGVQNSKQACVGSFVIQTVQFQRLRQPAELYLVSCFTFLDGDTVLHVQPL